MCGNMLSVAQQYLWDTAELLEGCNTDNVDVIDWNNKNHPVVKFSRMLALVYTNKDVRWDDDSFVTLKRNHVKKKDYAYTR